MGVGAGGGGGVGPGSERVGTAETGAGWASARDLGVGAPPAVVGSVPVGWASTETGSEAAAGAAEFVGTAGAADRDSGLRSAGAAACAAVVLCRAAGFVGIETDRRGGATPAETTPAGVFSAAVGTIVPRAANVSIAIGSSHGRSAAAIRSTTFGRGTERPVAASSGTGRQIPIAIAIVSSRRPVDGARRTMVGYSIADMTAGGKRLDLSVLARPGARVLK